MTKGPNHLVLHCFGTLTQKRRLVFVTLLNWVNVQMSKREQFHQGNVPLRQLLNEEAELMKKNSFNLFWITHPTK